MSLDDRPVKTDRFMRRDLVDELLLYDAAASEVHVLNATMREIYLRCDGQHSVAGLADALVEAFDVDLATARADTLAVVGQLIDLDILSLTGPRAVE